ncbi:MAG: response regulator [Planctomycetia bacterium]|nr:response regulator [Planctomycetia bacterium]
MNGLLLSDDLIFTSRITGTARALGLTVRAARDVPLLQALARQQSPSGVIVDLANPGLEVEALIAWLRDHCPMMPGVVAYGSHVDVETLKRARAAGCDLVLPRSKFVEDLPNKLPEWLHAAQLPAASLSPNSP